MKKPFAVTQKQINIDRLGEIRAEIAELQLEHDKLVARFTKTTGRFQGLEYKINVYDSHNLTFNHARARRLLGADTYARCWKRNEYRTLRITTLKADNEI
jgi:hypothetical protein